MCVHATSCFARYGCYTLPTFLIAVCKTSRIITRVMGGKKPRENHQPRIHVFAERNLGNYLPKLLLSRCGIKNLALKFMHVHSEILMVLNSFNQIIIGLKF